MKRCSSSRAIRKLKVKSTLVNRSGGISYCQADVDSMSAPGWILDLNHTLAQSCVVHSCTELEAPGMPVNMRMDTRKHAVCFRHGSSHGRGAQSDARAPNVREESQRS